MKKILALSFFPAFLPPRSGGEQRLFNLYKNLSRDYEIVLISSGHPDFPLEILQHSPNFREVRVPKSTEFSSQWQKLSAESGSGDLSAICLAASSNSFSALHEQYLKYYSRSDIIIHESPFLVDYDFFLGFDNKFRIYNSYNCEYDLYSKMHHDAKSDNIINIVKNAEQKIIAHSDAIFACSDDDAERLRDLYSFKKKIFIVPNGVSSFPKQDLVLNDNRKLIFIGSSHQPNVAAARFIIDNIAPHLPEFEFHIMGSCLDAGQIAANVISHGIVSDEEKRTAFLKARAAINPMEAGGGSSLKIADLAAHGVPIISTEIGVRGFDFIPDEHFIKAETSRFVETIRTNCLDDDLLKKVSKAANSHILGNYTWLSISERMSSFIATVCENTLDNRIILVLNDYDPYSSIGGGSTRTKGLYDGISKDFLVVFLCFSSDEKFQRSIVSGQNIVVLKFPKSDEHRAEEEYHNSLYYISASDIIALRHAAKNSPLCQTYRAIESASEIVICEHPYMVSIPHRFKSRFIYSSQNFELALKMSMLEKHPAQSALINDLARAESYAVGASSLVVAVSEADAHSLSSAYPISAPVIEIPNGAVEPALFDRENINEQYAAILPCSAVFLGSGHIPNVEAAQFIITEIASKLPEVQFHIIGSVCASLPNTSPPNVFLWGVVDDQAKAIILDRCGLAINPMFTGSGSNVKIADYLKNGLHVISTDFGTRGYDDFVGEDITTSSTDNFVHAIQSTLGNGSCDLVSKTKRREKFAGRLSMPYNGRRMAKAISDVLENRPRALFVTYRYNFPRRGGGEVYANHVIEGLADHGYNIDIVSPATLEIKDVGRFTSEFLTPGGLGNIPIGHPRIRSAKFPLDEFHNATPIVKAIWAEQPAFEKEAYRRLTTLPQAPCLAWGWATPETGGRWAFGNFGIYIPSSGQIRIKGNSIERKFITIVDGSGATIHEIVVSGAFELSFASSSGFVEFNVYKILRQDLGDPRPLQIYVSSVIVGGKDLVEQDYGTLWTASVDPEDLYEIYYAACQNSRSLRSLHLTDARGPFSNELFSYINENIDKYDLVITHNAVFRTATETIRIASEKNIPSILIPHAHFEDDYYHFDDVYEACRNASKVLVSPNAAVKFLEALACDNVVYHSPGIDVEEVFSDADVERFTNIYTHDEPYFLVLGRKSLAKGYREVIDAVTNISSTHAVRLVMIGPDDDGAPIANSLVTYLGMQDRSVIRGALQGCKALVNMSSSESFGIVLLEAGLAEAPVVANMHCAAFQDLVLDGENGFLVSPHELATCLTGILENENRRREMGKIGREMAKKFDWNKIVSEFNEICDGLIGKLVH